MPCCQGPGRSLSSEAAKKVSLELLLLSVCTDVAGSREARRLIAGL